MSIIRVSKLVKKYGVLTAVDGISFDVKKGEIFGLLGPNGAGKTTTLEIIEGLQPPSSGGINIVGLDPVKNQMKVKEKIGVQLQSSAFFDYLSLTELIDLFRSYYNLKSKTDTSTLLKMVGLESKSKSRVNQLSGGQKQRFSIIAALVNDPEVVFLDEPTTGLDPQSRRNLWDIIRDIRKNGKTIVMTTHYMEEAQTLCDRIAIIDQGKIITIGTPAQLIQKLDYQFRIVYRGKTCIDDMVIGTITDIVSQKHEFNEQIKIYTCIFGVKKVQDVLPKIITALQKKKLPFEDLEVIPSSLEDVFLKLTGKELRE